MEEQCSQGEQQSQPQETGKVVTERGNGSEGRNEVGETCLSTRTQALVGSTFLLRVQTLISLFFKKKKNSHKCRVNCATLGRSFPLLGIGLEMIHKAFQVSVNLRINLQ